MLKVADCDSQSGGRARTPHSTFTLHHLQPPDHHTSNLRSRTRMDADPWADTSSPSKTATPTRQQTASPSPPDDLDAPDPPAPVESHPPVEHDPAPASPPSSALTVPASDGFDDFDDFDDEPQAGPSQAVDDDDAFGDFDDFQEGDFEATTEQAETDPEPGLMPIAGPSWVSRQICHDADSSMLFAYDRCRSKAT